MVLSLRQSLYLPLDDLLYVTRQYINADVSRAGLARLLKREDISRLEDVIPKAEGETISPKKTFKDYEPGFVYIDIKYLLQMPDETSRCYLFLAIDLAPLSVCAIDRAARWVFMHIYGDMTNESSADFFAPFQARFAHQDCQDPDRQRFAIYRPLCHERQRQSRYSGNGSEQSLSYSLNAFMTTRDLTLTSSSFFFQI